MELLRIAVLMAGTLTVGVMAGVFFIFAVAVMPGLGRTDDRTFVGGFQAIDRAILTPVFLLCFLGALGFPALAAVLYLPEPARAVLPWVVGGLALYLVVFLITFRVHVPLNNDIKAAGHPDEMADLAGVRQRFESRWVRWNLLRTGCALAAFAMLAWALVVHGRL